MITEHFTLVPTIKVTTEICVDGDSAPFLELRIKAIRSQEWTFLSREQLEILITDLQSKLTEL